MSIFIETRTERCRYGREDRIIDDYKIFGWSFSSKQLMNRFGNPLPIDMRLSEKELRNKCFYDIVFTREAEKEDSDKLNSLQSEYFSYELKQTCFTGKRVTVCVFLTILLIAFIVLAVSKDQTTSLIGLILTIITALGLAGIIAAGIFLVFKNGRNNKAIIERMNQIEEDVGITLNKCRN